MRDDMLTITLITQSILTALKKIALCPAYSSFPSLDQPLETTDVYLLRP